MNLSTFGIQLGIALIGLLVMVCLSGDPGRHSETPGFIRDRDEVLAVLAGYLAGKDAAQRRG